ncbi:MAG TPA: carbohydrate-binding protein, partial [Pilimelia sp.]|nr:carbohydrate-binding protein [Pilimelia sp.]
MRRRKAMIVSGAVAVTVAAAWLVVPPTLAATSGASSAAAYAPCSDPAWAEGRTYTAGTKVTYNSRTYQALVTHTAHVGANWNPAATPSLWKDLGACEGAPGSPS